MLNCAVAKATWGYRVVELLHAPCPNLCWVEATGMLSYSSYIPAMTVSKSLSHVPPNPFFITSLGLAMLLTLPLCSASLCMALSPVTGHIIFLIHIIKTEIVGGFTNSRRKNQQTVNTKRKAEDCPSFFLCIAF